MNKFRSSMLTYVINVIFIILLIVDLLLFYVIWVFLSAPFNLGFRNLAILVFWVLIFTLIPALIGLKYRGAFRILIDEDGIVIKRILKLTKKLTWDEIRGLKIKSSKLGRKKLTLYSLDKSGSFDINQIREKDQLLTIINEKTPEQDEYVIAFQNRRDKLNLVQIMNSTTGKVGIGMLFIVLFLYLWGAIATLFYPTEVSGPNSFIINNPEFGFGLVESGFQDLPPGPEFLLGTDFVGRDYFARLVVGLYQTVNMALVLSIISLIIAIVISSISVFGPKFLDNSLTQLVDLLISIPVLVFWTFALAYSGAIREEVDNGYYWSILIVTVFFLWAGPARMIRNKIQEEAKNEYVTALRSLGASKWHILRKHLIPSILPLILALFFILLTEYIATILTIAIFLPSEGSLLWGSDINRRLDGRYYTDPQLFEPYMTGATIIITLTTLCFLLLGEAIKSTVMERWRK